MPVFKATIRDRDGIRRNLSRVGNAKGEVIAALRAEGCVVVGIEEARGTERKIAGLPPPWHPAWLRRMGSFDVEIGFQQLASMVRSGVSILLALETVADQAMSPRASLVWHAVRDKVASGTGLSEALAAQRGRFNEVVVQLVRVGEQSGELDSALLHAAAQLESQRNLRALVVNALMYPVFATVMAVAVSVFLVVGVIPRIAEFLEAGGAQLPAMTQMLVDAASWMRANGLAVLAVVAGLVAAFFAVRAFPPGRLALDTAALKLPVTGRIRRLSGTAVFARAMEMLVQSGVTLLSSLEVSRTLLGNRRLRGRIAGAYEAVLRGEPLAPSLKRAREFMPMLSQMVAVGETTGSLGDAFGEVAHFHEKMLAIAIRRFSAVIEPLMIVVVGGIVGFVYLAFFLALFSMAGAA